MKNPFPLTDLPDGTWAVSWPEFSEKFNDRMKFNMLECIFKQVQCNEVGLGVAESEYNETSILWISDTVYYQDITDEYCQYLHKYYNIRGAVFRKQHEAQQFKEILEKRYMWQLLQE